jgi:arylsulfatase A-like enzyme
MTSPKKNISKITALSIAASLLLIISACSKTDNSHSFSKKSLKFSLQAEHKYFDNDPKVPNYYYYKGWRTGSKHAVSPASIIRFFNFSHRNRLLNFTIMNPHAQDNRVLPLKAYLNDKFLSDLTVKEKKKEFSLTLPENQLLRGENFITFKLDEHFLKKDIISVHYKYRDYFILENIFFKDQVSFNIKGVTKKEKDSRLIQPANSIFSLAIDSNETIRINYKFEVKKLQANGKLTFFILRNKKDPIVIRRIELKGNEKCEAEIEFKTLTGRFTLEIEYLSSNQSSFLNWKEINRFNEPTKPLQAKNKLIRLQNKPHFFYIIIDAARYNAVNRDIQGKLTTPRIKDFSKTAYRFTNFYANAPYTVASVGTIFSGFLPEVHTVRDMKNRLPDKVKTLPVYFEDIGYTSRIITSNIPLYTTNLTRDVHNKHLVFCRQIGAKEFRNNSFVNIDIVKNTINNADFNTPQFFYIHLLPPHSPYNPRDSKFYRYVQYPKNLKNRHLLQKLGLAETYNLKLKSFTSFLSRAYLNNIYYADYLVGEILDTLKEKHIFDQSCIIIGSDHGEAFFEHGKFTHNTTNYNEMIHIPFFLKMPGQKIGYEINSNYSKVDILPTLHQLFNIPANKYWQGKPIIFAPKVNVYPERTIYSRAINNNYNLSIIYRHYKYIYLYGREELYNIKTDPTEKNNIINLHPDLRVFLRQKAFDNLHYNLNLRAKLQIRELSEKKRQLKVIEELKTLGYLN